MWWTCGCIISSFYIKPQLANVMKNPERTLYYIFILHQTTTACALLQKRVALYYIFILHQTTTCMTERNSSFCCIISSFYIKPQRINYGNEFSRVVLYLHSTSNHNQRAVCASPVFVVLYLHSTSNHNRHQDITW